MSMEFHQLRYFCSVAQTGSFTRAAEQQNVAQPSLSQQIQKLEEEIGAPLFERLGRGVRLTPCGEDLLPRAQTILREAEDAKRALEVRRGTTAGRLRVGVIPTIMPYWLAPRVNRFLKRCPDVDLLLIENTTARLVESLQSGDLDLALLSLPISNQDLICSELFREPVLLAVPPKHDLAQKPCVDAKELKSERLLILREGHCFRDDAVAVCKRARLQPNVIFESDQFSSIFALVAAGVGVSLVPQMAASAATSCKVVPLGVESYRRVGYAQVKRRFRSPALTAFIDWLKKEARPPQG